MSAAPFPQTIISPVLIGRAAPLEFLTRALERAAAGKGATVLLAGEAGIGKTRLAAETTTLALARGFEILAADCFETERASPFAPLSELLRVFAATRDDDSVTSAFHHTPQLLHLAPELVSRIDAYTDAPAFEPSHIPHAFVEFMLARVRPSQPRARISPLLILFEDLHWCDDATLECLRALARRVSSQPILALCTYRDNERAPALREWRAQLTRRADVFELTLAPLTRAETDALVCAMFQQTQPTRAEFLDALENLTEGNPFFIDQVLKALVAAGDIYFGANGWTRKPVRELRIPRTLQESVTQRTRDLSSDAQRVLQYAAVAGRRFDFAVLERVMAMTENELTDALKQALAAQLVVEESADEFAFRHELTRQAAYNAMLLRERKQLHRVVGEAMEAVYQADARAGELAYHFHAAGEWDKAYAYSMRAGEQAQRLYAPRAAVEHFTRALEAMQQRGLAAPAALYHARGKASALLGTFEPARADLENALELALDAREEWKLLLELALLWSGRDYAQTGAYLERALARARALNEPALLGASLNRLGNYLVNIEQPAQAIPHHREALAAFEQLNDARGLADTYDLLATTLVARGDWVEGSAFYLQAIARFRELDERAGLVSSLSMSSFRGGAYLNDTMITRAPLAEALRDGFAALELAQQTQQHAAEAMVYSALVMSLGFQGDYARAWDLARKAVVLAEQVEHRHWHTFAHIAFGALALDVLDFETARRQLEHALTMAAEIGSHFFRHLATAFFISTCVARNDLARAQAAFDAVIAPNTFAESNTQRQVWAARAELALAQNEPQWALEIATRLIETAQQIENFGGDAIPRLSALRGECLAQLERWAEAEEHLRAAVRGAQQQGARGLVWRSWASLARVFLAHGKREESVKAAEQARVVIAELADGWAEAPRDMFLARALAQLPAHRTTARRAAKLKYEGLTTREREIAGWIARGESNREIAARLVLSHRTVEGHISNILAKLSLDSRTEIAVWAVGRGMRDEG